MTSTKETIRFTIKHLLILIFIGGFALAFCTRLKRTAEREYASYQKLCDLGAVGDNWTSLSEMITGKPPIVKLNIPNSIQPNVAIKLLPDLRNLESLSISFESATDHELNVLRNLELQSLEFCGTFPRDRDLERLACFRSLKFLRLQQKQLSPESVKRLLTVLPNTKISIGKRANP